jgi:hypothetical protein
VIAPGLEAITAHVVIDVGLVHDGPLVDRPTGNNDRLQAHRPDDQFLGFQVFPRHRFDSFPNSVVLDEFRNAYLYPTESTLRLPDMALPRMLQISF